MSKLLRLLLIFCCYLNFSTSKAIGDAKTGEGDQVPINFENLAKENDQKLYTVNFDNVPAIELVKFISKIGKLNFVYDEKDLAFNATFTSEDSSKLSTIVAGFVQILRLNGLDLIEQGNNLVISNIQDVQKLATVVSPDQDYKGPTHPALITKVYNIKNGNPITISGLIGPLLSKYAIIEVSENTRHIIITDLNQNISEIDNLMGALDTPHTSLEIQEYTSKVSDPQVLVTLTNQIILPLTDGNPLLLVPQTSTGKIFIISTPSLVQRAVGIIENLDITPSNTIKGQITSKNILVYPIKNKPPDVLEKAIKSLATNIAKNGESSDGLLKTLQGMNYVAESNSLMFVGTPSALEEVEKILKQLDIPYSAQEKNLLHQNTFVYKIKNGSEESINASLQNLVKSLKKAPEKNKDLITAISSLEWNKSSNTLFFSGNQNSIDKIKQILPLYDVEIKKTNDEFLIYTPKNIPLDMLNEKLKTVYSELTNSNLGNPQLLKTLSNFKVSPSQNTLVFTGNTETLEQVKSIIAKYDIPPVTNTQFFVYKPKFASINDISAYINNTYSNLHSSKFSNTEFLKTLSSAVVSNKEDTITFTGTPDSISKVKDLLNKYDVSTGVDNFLVYTPKNISLDSVLEHIKSTTKNLVNSDLADPSLIKTLESVKTSEDGKSLTFIGNKESLDKVKSLLDEYDVSTGVDKFLVYTPKNISLDSVLEHIKSTTKNLVNSDLADPSLIKTLESIRTSGDGKSLTFTGNKESLDKVKSLLDQYDISTNKNNQFLVYTPKNSNIEHLASSLNSTYNNLSNSKLSDPSLLNALSSMKISKQQNTLTFTGSDDSLKKIRSLLSNFDVVLPSNNKFLVYTPKNNTLEDVASHIKNTYQGLSSSGLADTSFLDTLESMKTSTEQNTLTFTGTQKSLNQVQSLLTEYDIKKTGLNNQFYIYAPQNISVQSLEKKLNTTYKNLLNSKLADPELLKTLTNATVSIGDNNITFTGTTNSLTRLKTLIKTLDRGNDLKHFLYKPKNSPSEDIISRCKGYAEELKEKQLYDRSLIDTLDSASRVVPSQSHSSKLDDSLGFLREEDSIAFIGTDESIDQLKDLLSIFDASVSTTNDNSEFYIYNPIYITPKDLLKSVYNTGKDMLNAGLTDRNFISGLINAKISVDSQGVIFAGNKETIQKITSLMPNIDVNPTADSSKKQTFVIYKIKYLPGPALMTLLRNLANDLSTSDKSEKELINTINGMRYIKDSNSIVFTGNSKAVSEAQSLAEKFDIPSLVKEPPVRAPTGYELYQPKFMPGEELISVIKDFEQNLVSSGINDSGLFDVINNLKWMPQTSSILVSGENQETKKVIELLQRFDVPSPNKTDKPTNVGVVGDSSFLVYKLQYHSGRELQDALQLIGKDLSRTQNTENSNLSKSINSLQWIETTNSLIATGTIETLAKLKELINNIDVPLKQVFVEVLVIETTTSNNLQFGLRWGSQGNYMNRFSYGTGLFPSTIDSTVDPLSDFASNLSQVTATNTPTGSFIPFANGFDLGVIGDIILHKGQSYFALGSLVNAIKDDGDTIITMNQKLITQDNKMSTIFVGQNIPYTGSLVTNQSDNTVTTANLEYRDVGVSLSITPVVGNNDLITLMIEEDISEELSSAGGSAVSNATVTGITTSKNSTRTVVSVPDKSFLVLGGSIQNTNTFHRTGIPCLGGLPVIGTAFTDNEKVETISNLVIFVRPQIIKSFENYKELTQRQSDLFGSQTNIETFDASLELVKTPDDF